MRFLIFYVLNLWIVAVSSNCCLPRKWEGLEIYFIASIYNGSTITTWGSVNASVDSEQQKIAFSYNTASPRGFTEGFIIQDYRQKIQYNISNGNCFQSKIIDPIPSMCIESGSAVELKSFLTVGKTSVPVTRYGVPHTGDGHLTLLEESCTPLSYQIIGYIQGAISVKTSDIYGFSNRIKDPSVFDVPDICKSVERLSRVKEDQEFFMKWFSQ